MIRKLFAGMLRLAQPKPATPFAAWLDTATETVEPLDRWTPARLLYEDYVRFASAMDSWPLTRKAFERALGDSCRNGARIIPRRRTFGDRDYQRCWPLALRPFEP